MRKSSTGNGGISTGRTSASLTPQSLTLALGVSDALVRPVEMPPLPVDDLRMVLKHNSKTYLQQDLSNHVFDCHLGLAATSGEAGKGAGAAQKQRVLVTAA